VYGVNDGMCPVGGAGHSGRQRALASGRDATNTHAGQAYVNILPVTQAELPGADGRTTRRRRLLPIRYSGTHCCLPLTKPVGKHQTGERYATFGPQPVGYPR